jgi:hypothetical protein
VLSRRGFHGSSASPIWETPFQNGAAFVHCGIGDFTQLTAGDPAKPGKRSVLRLFGSPIDRFLSRHFSNAAALRKAKRISV